DQSTHEGGGLPRRTVLHGMDRVRDEVRGRQAPIVSGPGGVERVAGRGARGAVAEGRAGAEAKNARRETRQRRKSSRGNGPLSHTDRAGSRWQRAVTKNRKRRGTRHHRSRSAA